MNFLRLFLKIFINVSAFLLAGAFLIISIAAAVSGFFVAGFFGAALCLSGIVLQAILFADKSFK